MMFSSLTEPSCSMTAPGDLVQPLCGGETTACPGSRPPSCGEGLPSQPLWQPLSFQGQCGMPGAHGLPKAARNLATVHVSGACTGVLPTAAPPSEVRQVQSWYSVKLVVLRKAPVGSFPPQNPLRLPPKCKAPGGAGTLTSDRKPAFYDGLRNAPGPPCCSLGPRLGRLDGPQFPPSAGLRCRGPAGAGAGREVGVVAAWCCWGAELPPNLSPLRGDCPRLHHSGRGRVAVLHPPGAVGLGASLGKAGKPQGPCPSGQVPKC